MKQLQQGILIAVEGIDGSGKSTLASNIAQKLTQQSWPILLTKEPGDTALGKHVRSILHDAAIPKTAKAEFLLFSADRAQHMSNVVLPGIAEKKIVISDRMADSSVVYQGYARGLDLTMINLINQWTMEQRHPDIILYVQVSAQTASERLVKRNLPLTSFEQEPKLFFERLVEGFDTIMKSKPNAIILDGNQPPDKLATIATETILTWIQKNNISLS